MIQIMINFRVETQNLTKSTHFEIFIFIQEWLTKNMWSMRRIYVFLIMTCKKIHLNVLSYEKMKND
jgi:hypothetical protein